MNKHHEFVDLTHVKRPKGGNMLIQEYNARQAIIESKQPIKEFKLNHSFPGIVFNGISYHLLYSKIHIAKCRRLWLVDRPINVLYRVNSNGVDRIEKILNWQKLNPNTKADVQLITYDTRKDTSIKFFDEDYLNNMAKSKFAIIPDGLNRQGDYMVWTYRFIDAVLCGAIPIVESTCNLYDGFKYYYVNDELPKYDPEIKNHNIKHLISKLTIR